MSYPARALDSWLSEAWVASSTEYYLASTTPQCEFECRSEFIVQGIDVVLDNRKSGALSGPVAIALLMMN
jgi:hypothetical protein